MVNLISMFFPDGGVWSPILHGFYDGIGSYAGTIIVVMFVLKLLLTPLDFFQRRITSKNAKVQQVMKPELEKLKKQCGNNSQLYNQKQMEVYKKHNFNIMGTCGGMLLNIAITMLIFITLYSAMGNIASHNLKEQYPHIQQAYYTAVTETESYKNIYGDDKTLFDDAANKTAVFIDSLSLTDDEKNDIKEAVWVEYSKNNESFLWVNSLWRSDTVMSTIPSFSEYQGIANLSFTDDNEKAVKEAEYNMIMQPLSNYLGSNGTYGLIIITVCATVLSQLLMWLTNRPRGKEKERIEEQKRKDRELRAQANLPGAKPMPSMPKIPANMIMMIILPIIMLVFTLSSNAAFAIYIIITQLVSAATIPITSTISRKIDEKKARKEEEKVTVDYRRK